MLTRQKWFGVVSPLLYVVFVVVVVLAIAIAVDLIEPDDPDVRSFSVGEGGKELYRVEISDSSIVASAWMPSPHYLSWASGRSELVSAQYHARTVSADTGMVIVSLPPDSIEVILRYADGIDGTVYRVRGPVEVLRHETYKCGWFEED